MKRIIKSRAWQDNKMIYQADGSVQSVLEFYKKLYYDLDTECIMQFTGLTDKNRKEIFEGDVLKLQYPINYGFGGIHNKEIIVKITFENGCFWFSGDGFTDCNWHFYDAKDREVIGNIYENPELK